MFFISQVEVKYFVRAFLQDIFFFSDMLTLANTLQPSVIPI